MLNREEIMQIIPHRDPMLLIDEIREMVPGESAVAVKHVTGEEDFFRGHFPQYKVMPGVLIVEAMAQAGAVAILSLPEYRGKLGLFGGIDECRFRGQVVPGDELELRVTIVRRRGPIGIGDGAAYVNGKRVARAKLTFAVVDSEKTEKTES